MRLVIVAVGRVKDRPLRAALDEYFGRVRRYVACDEVEIPDGPLPKVAQAMTRATAGANVIALEVGGRALPSEAFASSIERWGSRGKGVVAFLIGGADGLPPEVSAAADDRWSLSTLTFPHRLARLVLVEQLYRAMTILRGEPYGH
ncbi:23S rRNA (pseudouridine(1915)-N(3))-methyltransferase RlmH [Chondromyces crocatus]|uniref:Ribosomal RNA large subunit methyltransferase H n=1 Tax=Chondromyces crocatus TaxID=52 RepID=A0A0K1EHL2_CHOCO|nr:23S rRNA (pseudouridine(1915)-N(3))-methyltransferase RlmH [Chondromyces crocatus]AKT40366.1 ribosomal RNA large subunit methyltransferase H [Chondromyces crocatus]